MKPLKKKKKFMDFINGQPAVTPTVFSSDGLTLALVKSDNKEFYGRRVGGSGFQHFISVKHRHGSDCTKLKFNYPHSCEQTIELSRN